MIQHNRSKDFQKPYPVVVILKNGFAVISTRLHVIKRMRNEDNATTQMPIPSPTRPGLPQACARPFEIPMLCPRVVIPDKAE